MHFLVYLPTRGKSLLESWGTTFLPDRQPPLGGVSLLTVPLTGYRNGTIRTALSQPGVNCCFQENTYNGTPIKEQKKSILLPQDPRLEQNLFLETFTCYNFPSLLEIFTFTLFLWLVFTWLLIWNSIQFSQIWFMIILHRKLKSIIS